MKKNNYKVIGVMSGTSLDGVDLAHINFKFTNKKWCFDIQETETIEYNLQWIKALKTAVDFSSLELDQLNKDYTVLLASIIKNFIKKNNIQNIDAVCSHGHTILHQPQNGYTLQIGNLPEISKLIEQTVVCDFRVQDVNLGGQGAPLVPIGDRILFSEYDFCLNLGGFSNVSFEQLGKRIAFDISPVNTVLNHYANQLGFHYDDKGNLSRSGELNNSLLDELNSMSYFDQKSPKSLGYEFVKRLVIPLIDKYEISTIDKLRTYSEHISYQTAKGLNKAKGKILITGGGAHNDFLIERIKCYLPYLELHIPLQKILEYKEALIFGLLGILKLRGEINVLSSVTGALKDHSSGNIFKTF